MKSARILIAILATFTFASIAAAQCGPPAKAMDATESQIIANEKIVSEAAMKNDSVAFKSLVSMDAWVVSGNGTAKVSDIFQYMFDPNSKTKTSSYSLEDPKVMMINPTTALITYKSVWAGTIDGKAKSETTFDSTLWVKRDGKWWAVFHQSTEMAKPQEKIAAPSH